MELCHLLFLICGRGGASTRQPPASRRGRFLRGILLEIGVSRETALIAGYNRLRRFMPTLSSCLQLSPVELQAVGNWSELPEGGGPKPTGRCSSDGLAPRRAQDSTVCAGEALCPRLLHEVVEAQAARASVERLWPGPCSQLVLAGGVCHCSPSQPCRGHPFAASAEPGARSGSHRSCPRRVEAALSDLPVAAEGAPSEAASEQTAACLPRHLMSPQMVRTWWASSRQMMPWIL